MAIELKRNSDKHKVNISLKLSSKTCNLPNLKFLKVQTRANRAETIQSLSIHNYSFSYKYLQNKYANYLLQ